MADLQLFQNRLNGGEISPQLEGRVDNDRYNAGARLLENFIVKPNGSISKRPGTEYLAELDGQSRVITYRADEDTNFILVYSENNIRPYNQDGTPVTVLSSDMVDYNAVSAFSYGATYYKDDIIYSTIDDRYYIVTSTSITTSTDPGSGFGSVYNSYDYYTFTAGTIVLSGSAPGRAFRAREDIIAVQDFEDEDYWTELENVSQAASPYYTNEYYCDLWSPYTVDELFEIQTTQINDILFNAQGAYSPVTVARYSDTDWRTSNVEYTFAPGEDYNATTTTVKFEPAIPKWGNNYRVWATSTYYREGEWVGYNGNLYVVNQNHQSSLAPPALEYDAAVYTIGEKVYNSNNEYYTTITYHLPLTSTSSQYGEPGITTGSWGDNWVAGINEKIYNSWVSTDGVSYAVGDVYSNDGKNYRCRTAHTIGSSSFTTIANVEPGVGTLWYSYWDAIESAIDTSYNADEFYLISSDRLFSSANVGESWQIFVTPDNNVANINLKTQADNSLSATKAKFYQGDYVVSTSWTVGGALSGDSTVILKESLDNINFQDIKVWEFDGNGVENNISYTGEAPAGGAWYKLEVSKVGGGTGAVKIEPVINQLVFNAEICEYVNPTKVLVCVKAGLSPVLPENVLFKNTSTYKKAGFTSVNGYPTAVAYHEQRLWFGGVSKYPGRVWASAKNRLYDFKTGVLDTDAIDITIASKSTNQTSWIQPLNRYLVVATAGDIYTIDSGSTTSGITPTQIRASLRSSIGAARIQPSNVGNSIQFVQTGSNRLREFIFSDQTESFICPDLTIMADHIAEDQFIDLAYQSNIDQTTWIVNSKGGLAGYTFNFAEGVGAWHRHFTGSRSDYYGVTGNPGYYDTVNGYPDMFTSIAILNPTGSAIADQIWFVVKRWVNGQYKYFLERFDPTNMDFIYGANESTVDRWRFVDSYREYNTASPDGQYTEAVDEESFLYDYYFSHLNNGTTQWILSAGGTLFSSVASPGGKIKISNGSIYLLTSHSPVLQGSFVVGLPVYSTYQPTRVNINMGNGGSQGRLMRLNRFALRLWRSYGGNFAVYDPIQYSITDAVTGFEFHPVEGDTLDDVDYDKFTFNLSNQYPKITLNSYYTGQTSDQYVNGNWSNNPIFTVVHNEPTPFNILGVVYKAEVSSN